LDFWWCKIALCKEHDASDMDLWIKHTNQLVIKFSGINSTAQTSKQYELKYKLLNFSVKEKIVYLLRYLKF